MVSAPSMHTDLDSPTRSSSPQGARLVSTAGVELPLSAADLDVDAKGGLARVQLTQSFVNTGPAPVNVKYLLPLPADGAVSGFEFTVAGSRVVGQVDKKQVARARYEAALMAGKTAALLEETRTSVFSQEVGNVPAGETVQVQITVDQPLAWLADRGAWQWRFPTVVGIRYQGAPGRVKDADQLAMPVSTDPVSVRMGLRLRVRDGLAAGAAVSSGSHTLYVSKDKQPVIRFAEEGGARLNRDIVMQWPVADLEPGASLDVCRPVNAVHAGDGYALLTLVPPAPGVNYEPVSRDLIVLIDTSGSMGGEPLNQAKRVVSALIRTLKKRDRVELIAFDFSPRRFREEPVAANAANRKSALSWIEGLSAGGGTEMHIAVQDALRTLRADAQRQVVLVTDGYIGFEEEIVHKVRTALPAACRLHTVGVGSSVNRTLTQAAARAGAGVEVIIAPGEDPESAVRRIIARTDRPVVTELTVSGAGVEAVAPLHLPDLFAGAPTQVSLRLGRAGEITIRGRTADGKMCQTLHYTMPDKGQGAGQIAVRYAREHVADLEAYRAAGGDAQEINGQIEQTGLDFQIATRLTSWVAVSTAVMVDPGQTVETVEQPQEVPEFISLAGFGLRAPASLITASAPAPSAPAASAARPIASAQGAGAASQAMKRRSRAGRSQAPSAPVPPLNLEGSSEVDTLMDTEEDAFDEAEVPSGPPLTSSAERAVADFEDDLDDVEAPLSSKSVSAWQKEEEGAAPEILARPVEAELSAPAASKAAKPPMAKDSRRSRNIMGLLLILAGLFALIWFLWLR